MCFTENITINRKIIKRIIVYKMYVTADVIKSNLLLDFDRTKCLVLNFLNAPKSSSSTNFMAIQVSNKTSGPQ